MKKWMKSKLLTIITVIVVAGVGIGSLLNASKLESLFNPGKFKKFENRYHSDKYDYAAGDGDDMNLADEDKDGKGKEEEQQQVLPVSEPEKKKGENDLGIVDSKNRNTSSDKKNGVEFTDAKDTSNKKQNGTNTSGTNTNGGIGTNHNDTNIKNTTDTKDKNVDNPSDNNNNRPDNTGNKNDTNDAPGNDNNGNNNNNDTDSPSNGDNKDNTSNKPEDSTSSGDDNKKDEDNKISWEDEQLKPKDPVETADGKLTLLSVTMKKSEYTKGESFSAEDADVTATFEKKGKKTDKTLSYGGSDGYSVTFSTKKTGDQTAIFSYKGTTVRAAYKVLSNYVNICYAAAYENSNDRYFSSYPGTPLESMDKDSYSALKEAVSFPNNTVTSGNIFNLMDVHKKIIAHLGDASIKKAFESFSGGNYPTTVFLTEDNDGYLMTMSEGFRYVCNAKFQDARSYVYYPFDKSWDTTGRNIVNVISTVPSGYKIRRVTSDAGDLKRYSADQVLEGYTGSDTILTVPMGVTKIALTIKAAQITKPSIPQSVDSIDAKTIAANLPNLTDSVAADSEKEMAFAGYKIVDGVLYSADGKTLLSVPSGKKKVTVPVTVTKLAKDCFRGMSKDSVIIFNSEKAPTVEDETGYTGTITIPSSEYNTIYKRYMFAFGKEANSITFSDTEGQKGLYIYKDTDKTLRYKEKENRLAAIAPEITGEYTVSADITSIGSGAFADCQKLTDIILGSQTVELCENSLVVQSNVETITLKAEKTDTAQKIFGNPASGCEVPNIIVYVGSAVYETYLADWTEVLDPVYGENTAKTLLQTESVNYIYEDGVKYQKLYSGSKEGYRLVAVYQKSKTALQVKEGTIAVSARAFADCASLEILSLPATLTEISEGLFTDCTSLETVVCNSKKTEISSVSGITDSADVYYAGKEYASFEYEKGIIYGKNTAGERTLLNVPTDYEGEFVVKKNTVSYGEEAFKNCNSVTLFTDAEPAALREIGARCFENSDGFVYFDWRENTSLTKVGEGAFKDCHNVEWIRMPDSFQTASKQMCYNDDALVIIEAGNLTKIEDEAFYGCDSLERAPVTKVESIGEYAFYGCRILESLVLPETLTSIGESSFENCTNLKTIEINADIPGIPRYCFYGCRKLTKVSFDSESKTAKNSLKVVGAYAFSQCTTLEKMDFSSFHNLSQIGEGAFSCDVSLLNVKLPDSLQKINKDCFELCSSLSILQLNSETVTQLGETIFGENLSEYVNIWVRDSVLADYATAYKEILDPEYGEGTAENLLGVVNDNIEVIKGVEFEITDEGRILKHASKNLSGKYTVPEDTIAIADEAFMDCTKLTQIVLPRGASIRLGDRCFKNCTGLLTIQIYSAIPEWGEETFMNCTSASKLEIGATQDDPFIERIGTRAFKNCTGFNSLAAIEIRMSVRTLGAECFADCENLPAIGISANFKAQLEVIEDKAFSNCKSLNAFLVSTYSGLKRIGAYAFENCDSLKSPSVPVNVTSVGEGCFMNCDNLQYVSFYGAVAEYPKDCFKNCPKLSRTGGTATAFAALKKIGDSAYEGCGSLTASASWSIGRYRNLETIGEKAFKGCKNMATGVVVNSDIKAYIYTTQLAASVTSVGANAFDGCTGMSALIFQSEKPPVIGDMNLSSMADAFGIYVLDSKANGDNIYKAYLEDLTKVLGEEKAYDVLDSISDGARDRYKKELEKEKQPDAASEKVTESLEETTTEAKQSESVSKTEDSSTATENSTEPEKTSPEGEKSTEKTTEERKETTKEEKTTEKTNKTEETSAVEQKNPSKDIKISTEKNNENDEKGTENAHGVDEQAAKEEEKVSEGITEDSETAIKVEILTEKKEEEAEVLTEDVKMKMQIPRKAEKGKEE